MHPAIDYATKIQELHKLTNEKTEHDILQPVWDTTRFFLSPRFLSAPSTFSFFVWGVFMFCGFAVSVSTLNPTSNIFGRTTTRKSRCLGHKRPLLVPWPLQNSRGLPWYQILSSEVRNRRLTAWTMTRSFPLPQKCLTKLEPNVTWLHFEKPELQWFKWAADVSKKWRHMNRGLIWRTCFFLPTLNFPRIKPCNYKLRCTSISQC